MAYKTRVEHQLKEDVTAVHEQRDAVLGQQHYRVCHFTWLEKEKQHLGIESFFESHRDILTWRASLEVIEHDTGATPDMFMASILLLQRM